MEVPGLPLMDEKEADQITGAVEVVQVEVKDL